MQARRGFAALVTLTLLSAARVAAAEPAPAEPGQVTLPEMVGWLKARRAETEIVDQVRTRGVALRASDASVRALRAAGMKGDTLIEAINRGQAYRAPVLVITDPRPGQHCGSPATVTGTTTVISGKHLWLFAAESNRARRGDWWPQPLGSKVGADGAWTATVQLGGQNNVGGDFHILAMWVDPEDHARLQAYMAKAQETRQFPPVKRPDGYPQAELSVLRMPNPAPER
jgi:hypothetical protein